MATARDRPMQLWVRVIALHGSAMQRYDPHPQLYFTSSIKKKHEIMKLCKIQEIGLPLVEYRGKNPVKR